MPKTQFLTLLLILICVGNSFAQIEQRTIKVTGTAVTNVSPDEIILEIKYQEYFTSPDEEREEDRVTIDEIESSILKSLKAAKVADDKITQGGISVIRPSIYENRKTIFRKRRLEKSLFICVNNTEELIEVVRKLEAANLMDDIITTFEIVETRHTDVINFRKQVKVDAFKNAEEKATLILSTSQERLGSVLSVKEIRKASAPIDLLGSTYESVVSPGAQASGFKPILIEYSIEVLFEIQ